MVQLLHTYMTTGETIALTIQPVVVSKYACINRPCTDHFREVFAQCWGSLCAALYLLVLGPMNFTCFDLLLLSDPSTQFRGPIGFHHSSLSLDLGLETGR